MRRRRTTGCTGPCCRRHHLLCRPRWRGRSRAGRDSLTCSPSLPPERFPRSMLRFFPRRSLLLMPRPRRMVNLSSAGSRPGISRLRRLGTGGCLLMVFPRITRPTTLRVSCCSSAPPLLSSSFPLFILQLYAVFLEADNEYSKCVSLGFSSPAHSKFIRTVKLGATYIAVYETLKKILTFWELPILSVGRQDTGDKTRY